MTTVTRRLIGMTVPFETLTKLVGMRAHSSRPACGHYGLVRRQRFVFALLRQCM